MSRAPFLAVLIGAAACYGPTSSARAIRGPDGDWWWSIRCRKSVENCWDEASLQCPSGYVVAGQDSQTGAVVVSGTRYSSSGAWTNASVVPTYRGNMLVKCTQGAAPPETVTSTH